MFFGFASWNGVLNHATGQATIDQAIGSYALNAAAFFATGGINQIAGLAAIETAMLSSMASGGLIGDGNAALQGGGASEIFAGAVGGALLGGISAFLGGAAMMGLGEIASNIKVDGVRSLISEGLCKVNDLGFKASNAGAFGGLAGGLGGNLFQFEGVVANN